MNNMLMLGASSARSGGSSGLGPQWPTITRSAFSSWPQPEDYYKDLPFTPSAGRDLNFYRGNFCGLRIPGAPTVPGSNAANPTCIMSCLLDNYPEEIQNEFLEWYASYGYTHLQRSMGHALGYGHTMDSFIALTKKAREQYGLYSDVWFIANELPGFRKDSDASYWGPLLEPYIKQLLDAGVIDLACVGWQMDQWNVPGNPIISIIANVAAQLPSSIPLYTHWMNEALAWWADGGQVWSDQYQTINVHDRFTWWRCMNYYLTGGHHQGNTRMLCKEYQDRICDTLDYFGSESGRDTGKGDMGQSLRTGSPKPFLLTVFECSGQDQFDDTPDNPYAISEAAGDQRGYILTCTTSQWGHLSGYGNGGKRPDGSPL